jgi:hypothetical protein
MGDGSNDGAGDAAGESDSTPGDGASSRDDGGASSEPDVVEVAVDAQGAMLMGDGVSLSIPEGALTDAVDVSLAALDADAAQQLATPTADGLDGTAELASPVFAFTPHGTRFAEPVEVELLYEGEGNVVLRLDDERDETWEIVEGALLQDGVARFEIDGFSLYAVAAAMRACQRATCNALPESLECGLVDDDCGGQVDLQSDCGRPACGEGQSCGENNTCETTTCESTFDCATTTAECGVEVDNCGVEHDVVAECAEINGCGANGTCSDINLCGECTPYAGCEEALAAAGDACNPEVPDGCGGTLDCGDAVCDAADAGDACFFVEDQYSDGGGYYSCEIPCSSAQDCPASDSWCEGNEHWISNWWCEDAGYCGGIGGFSDCGIATCSPTDGCVQ